MNNKASKIHPCAKASWFSFAGVDKYNCMKFKKLFSLIIGEDNIAGGGTVFGPGSVNPGPDMQGDHIYSLGDARNAFGRSVISRRGIVKSKKRKRLNRRRSNRSAR